MRIHREDVRRSSSGRAALGLLAVAGLLVLAGCEDQGGGAGPGMRFNHKRHAEEDLKCEACHTGATKAEKAGIPSAKTCLKCHEGIDAKLPAERRMQAQLVNGELPPLRLAGQLPEDVKFSHKAHADARVQCATCHKDVANSKVLQSKLGIAMKDCLDCHAKVHNVSGLKDNCAYCHKTISRDVKPASHNANWKPLHGKAIGFMAKGDSNRCETCHTQAWCLKCHRQEKPANHTNYWRDRGHNVAAEDRRSCRVCHQEDFCIRCHRYAAPIVRAARITQHRNTTSEARCQGCHFEGTANGRTPPHRDPSFVHCLQCHRVR